MRAVSLISFRDELLKIAMSVDAETRNNMAMRHEVPDFLLEGRLASNDSKETGFIPKLGGNLKLPKTKEEFQSKYRKIRKPAASMARGALVASLIANIASGGRAKQGYLGYSTPALLGAGAGLADYAAMGKKKKPSGSSDAKASVPKLAMLNSSTFTPGRALTTARNTGSFQSKLVHKGVEVQPATSGRAFRIPEG